MELPFPEPRADPQTAAGEDGDDGAPATPASFPVNPRPSRPNVLATISALVRRHRIVVVTIVLVVLVATVAAAQLIPRRFTAHADLWLDHGFDEPARDTAAGATDPRSRNTEIRVVTSNGLLASVVDKLGLANVRGIGQPDSGAPIARDTARRIALAAVRDNLKVTPTDTSYAVAVSYRAPDRLLATGILNQTLDRYVEERRIGGSRGRQRLRTRADLASARDEAMRAQAAFEGYREAAVIVSSEHDRASISSEIAALDAELRTAKAAQAAAETRLGQARADAAAPGGVTSPRIAELRAQLATLGSEQGAAKVFGPVDVRRADVGAELAAETRRASNLIETARKARARTSLLDTARARMEESLHDRVTAINQLAKLGKAAAAARDAYAALNRRYTEQSLAERTAPGTAYVIAHATPGTSRGFPSPALLALAGVLSAVIAAALVIALLEAFVKGFRSRQHLERKLEIPVLGQVPDLAKTPAADLAEDDAMGPPDYLYLHPHSPFGAAFRAIHTGLQLGGGARGRRSIAVCSALQTEGKTTVAICLARSAAMAGLRVVLVDCDARRPAASRALSAHVPVGLVDVLTKGIPFREALQRDTPSGAWFLAQSTGRPTPSETIASGRMTALVAKLVNEFDLVILDTPPTLALAESRSVAAMADGVLLVVRARTTPVGAARLALQMLVRADAKITGATLTLVDP